MHLYGMGVSFSPIEIVQPHFVPVPTEPEAVDKKKYIGGKG